MATVIQRKRSLKLGSCSWIIVRHAVQNTIKIVLSEMGRTLGSSALKGKLKINLRKTREIILN
jgi:hypothetical protein